MKVLIIRTMPEFSMDVYADGIMAGLKAVRPDWQIEAIAPRPLSRASRSWGVRWHKYYERFWSFPRRVKDYQKDYQADLIHIIDHSDGHLAYDLSDKPIVITCHDLINYFYPQNLQGSVQIPFISNALWRRSIQGMRHADHVISVSQQTAQDIQQILNIPSQKLTVVPNAVAGFHPLSTAERQATRLQYHCPLDTLCLLNVGSNHPRKNLDTILQVVQRLAPQISVQLWKVGADFTPAQKEAIAHYDIPVTYLGHPDQATLRQIYNAADLLLAPSTHEGFGLTLLEAMACGTAVVTANQSAMPEVVGDAGVLVDPLNGEAIAAAVLHLRQDSSYQQTLITRGLERVKTFTWEQVAEQIAQIYEGLLPISIVKQEISR